MGLAYSLPNYGQTAIAFQLRTLSFLLTIDLNLFSYLNSDVSNTLHSEKVGQPPKNLVSVPVAHHACQCREETGRQFGLNRKAALQMI